MSALDYDPNMCFHSTRNASKSKPEVHNVLLYSPDFIKELTVIFALPYLCDFIYFYISDTLGVFPGISSFLLFFSIKYISAVFIKNGSSFLHWPDFFLSAS